MDTLKDDQAAARLVKINYPVAFADKLCPGKPVSSDSRLTGSPPKVAFYQQITNYRNNAEIPSPAG
jgi:hypothetical protein